jgi:hypothetical protein
LAVRFNPLRVLPHANFIVWSPGFCSDAAHAIRKYLLKLMLNCRGLKGRRLYPAIACYRLRAPEDLRKVTSYLCKPIDLAHAYLSASELVNFDPVKMIALNADLDHFLEFHPMLFRRLRRISHFGRCCAVHHQYLGHVTDYRQMQRDRNEERRVPDAIDAGVGLGPYRKQPDKMSGFERWENDLRKYGFSIIRPGSRFLYWHRAKFRNCVPPPPRSIIYPVNPLNAKKNYENQ